MNKRFFNGVIGVSIFLLIGGILGIFAGLLCYVLLNFFIPKIDSRQKTKQKSMGMDLVNEFIELVLLGMNSGLSVFSTLELNRENFPVPLQKHVDEVIRRCHMGMSLTHSLDVLENLVPELKNVLQLLRQSIESGAPITVALSKIYEVNQKQSDHLMTYKIRSLGVRCVLPLGLCFLPAFLVITIVPIVASVFQLVIQQN